MSVHLLLLLLCCLCCGSLGKVNEARPHGQTLQKVLYDNATYPDAVCNDGSPSGFYILPATDPAKADLWVVVLEGGQWCYDDFSCGVRAQQNPQLTTSTVWPPYLTLSGIFDGNTKRNPVAGANLVYAGAFRFALTRREAPDSASHRLLQL
jgi:Pectinacetylesterase